MCFPDTDVVLRTHDEFLNQTQVEHHTGTTILLEIPQLCLISSFPLDYMHLHCLGIMKKMILLWLNGKPPFKLSAFKIAQISENLINQSKNIPVEFCRKPRKLEEANCWKATEFRQFLLYSGIIVLQGVLPRRYYGNFLALQLSTFILCNPDADETQLIYAHSLNKYFVKTFKILYGIEHVVHNIHNLLHVVDDVRIFGSLDSYSAFPFENFLQTIKKIIRKPSCPIQQVINRFFEANVANINIVSRIKKNKGPNKKHNNGPLVDNESIDLQYSEYQFPNFVLKASSPNNVCGLRNGHIILIENFVLTSTNQMCLIGKRFLEIDNFFIDPCPSSNLRIFKV